MVASLAEGVGLTVMEIKNFGPFYKSIAACLPHFYRRKPSDGGGPPRGDLTGRAAIRELLVDVRLQLKDRDVLQLKVLQPLRTYSWMLEGLEIVEVNNWIVDAVRAHAAGICKLALKDGGGDDVVVVSSTASSSASSTLATVGLLSPSTKIVRKPEAEVKTKSGAVKSDLMKFFAGKATM